MMLINPHDFLIYIIFFCMTNLRFSSHWPSHARLRLSLARVTRRFNRYMNILPKYKLTRDIVLLRSTKGISDSRLNDIQNICECRSNLLPTMWINQTLDKLPRPSQISINKESRPCQSVAVTESSLSTWRALASTTNPKTAFIFLQKPAKFETQT